MRTLLEIAVLAALIACGWNKSFSERISLAEASAPPIAKSQVRSAVTSGPRAGAPAAPASVANPSPTPSGAWMWDPKRPGALDRKASPLPQRP